MQQTELYLLQHGIISQKIQLFNLYDDVFSFSCFVQMCEMFLLPFTEAHPERFNSRLRNKMFYGQAGGKDLLRRKWKGLAEFVTLECDGKDMTPKLKDHKVHAIVFLNIPRYEHYKSYWDGSLKPVTKLQGLIP
jgi:hypothetical protein